MAIMTTTPLSINDLRAKIHSGESKDPLTFLESLMNGQDPRRLSDIYTLVLDIDEFSDGVPSASDWAEVVDLVMNRYKYYPVPLSESMNATKTLAEYIYPKRKQIDIRESSALDDAVTRPLTPEEVDLFAERFNDEF